MECVVYAHTQDKNNITAYIVVNVNNVHYPVQYKILEGENFGKLQEICQIFLPKARQLAKLCFKIEQRIKINSKSYRLAMATSFV